MYFKSKLIYIEISLIDFILSFGPFKFPKVKFKICKRDFFPFIYSNPRGKLFDFRLIGIQWKDKYDTPRFEEPPCISLTLYKISFLIYFNEDCDYWEQYLWYKHYYDVYSQGLLCIPNIYKARDSWPWIDPRTKKSTWNDKYLTKNTLKWI